MVLHPSLYCVYLLANNVQYVLCTSYILQSQIISQVWISVVQLCFRENVDQTSDECEYEKEIQAEVVELEVQCEEDYQRKLAEYKKQQEEWRLWRRKKVPIGA